MPPLKTTLRTLAVIPILGAAFVYQRTKNSQFVPLSPNDPIFSSSTYLKNNPHKNPATQDLCIRRVPISKIKPGLVDALLKAQAQQAENEGDKKDGGVEESKVGGEGKGWSLGGLFGSSSKVEEVKVIVGDKAVIKEGDNEGEEYGLVEHFCAGVWSGLGYVPQRRILARKYQHLPDRTASPTQLWTRQELKTSTYPIGTQITDHFEVVSKTPSAITVRCGDSPLNAGLRDSDGVFEMGVKVLPAEGLGGIWGAGKEGEVEFSLKSVFYKGLTASPAGTTEGPMPLHIEYLHKLYTKIWMETAIYNVMV